jgi:hypothetical protein
MKWISCDRKGESLQRQLDNITSPSEASVPEKDLGYLGYWEEKRIKMLPYLNVIVDIPVEEAIKEELYHEISQLLICIVILNVFCLLDIVYNLEKMLGIIGLVTNYGLWI